nr:Brevis radix-like domain-containing protein [Tanacetum cinerariifolium]
MIDTFDLFNVNLVIVSFSWKVLWGRIVVDNPHQRMKILSLCVFTDESTLIWISNSGERSLKLGSVSRIIPGQRTAVFRRYLRPEKDYLSFSLIYDNGKRSLDLICKDKVEAEAWIAGLKALISSLQGGLQAIVPLVLLEILVPLTFPVSVSSAPSTSSHGSGTDDSDALGDVYIWGEVICDNVVKLGPDKNMSSLSTRTDVLLPRPLESNVVLDVNQIACGVRHAALITKQGELFTWGEETGGRLGHGVGKDVTQPRLVESLAVSNIDFVACGEFHTCAVTSFGEMYTWGDGTHNVGLLGHGTDVSHWIPKRISGPLEGLNVASVTCGPWHTALITSTGQLFTFGDGTFGVLGHGKLFTWGDGDKNRLGHGDKEPRLKPTCVPALIDYNFHKVACGHSLTVGLTTSGHLYTMGSTVYGQLGNPQCDGKLPCLVEGKLANSFVDEVTCGAYHVTVLTSKNEVYTWGKGANGRLGHGDIEDRKSPTIVESLRDRHVKYISCGSNYTAAICVHKWVSGAEQSQCSSCRQAFGFTRKRHNCYNCGLVHCHSCSSKKAPRAALAPNPGKPYRVCDSCFTKLSKVAETGINSRRNVKPRLSGENKDWLDKTEIKLAKSGVPSNQDLIKLLDNKAAKQGKKGDAFYGRSSQTPSLMQLKDVVLSGDFRRVIPKPVNIQSGVSSRSVSPFSRKSSPPRSATPVPTTTGLSFSKGVADDLKKSNELLNQEVLKLRGQVDSWRRQFDIQELELQKSMKKTQEAMALAAEESAKCKAAKDVIKSLTAQLKDMAERLPPGSYDFESIRYASDLDQNGHDADVNGDDKSISNGSLSPSETLKRTSKAEEPMRYNSRSPESRISNGKDEYPNGDVGTNSYNPEAVEKKGSVSPRDEEKGDFKPRSPVSSVATTTTTTATTTNHVEAEWIEQYEPGVYITLVALRDGTRDLKRVRFSRRRFRENQAETWWSENREQVNERYNVRGSSKSSVSSTTTARRSGESVAPATKY